MALFQSNMDINQIAGHIFILLDVETLSNLEKINAIWSRHLRDPMLWLRLCMRKEAKWFKNQDQDSNQTFVEYKSANLQWYDLLEGLDDSQDQELKESLLTHLKLRFDTSSKSTGIASLSPFAFAAKHGNLALAKHIVTNTDPFKNMKRSAMIDVEEGEVLNDEVVPFDPTLIPIHTAAMFGQFEVVKFLMETYSHLNEVIDESNHTPIEYAITKGHRKVFKLLLSFPMKGIIKKKAFNLAMAKPSYTMAFQIDKWRTFRIVLENVLYYERWGCRIVPTILMVILGIDVLCIFISLYEDGYLDFSTYVNKPE